MFSPIWIEGILRLGCMHPCVGNLQLKCLTPQCLLWR